MRKNKKLADLKRKQLTSLLAKPIFPKGFSGKYPLATGELVMPMIQSEIKEKAVDVMKAAAETYKANKSKFVKLYKGNKNKKERREGVIKLPKFKKESKGKRKFKRRS